MTPALSGGVVCGALRLDSGATDVPRSLIFTLINPALPSKDDITSVLNHIQVHLFSPNCRDSIVLAVSQDHGLVSKSFDTLYLHNPRSACLSSI